jgi:hypothetical protein
MSLLGFGQPQTGVFQIAYVVEDIEAGMGRWVEQLNVGPWFLLAHFTGERATYRGEPAQADSALAMAYAGHMLVELIQPNDEKPSVYREAIERGGYGFHHFGVSTLDYDADVAPPRAGTRAGLRSLGTDRWPRGLHGHDCRTARLSRAHRDGCGHRHRLHAPLRRLAGVGRQRSGQALRLISAPASLHRFPPALRTTVCTEARYRLLFVGQVMSLIGDRVMLVALPGPVPSVS